MIERLLHGMVTEEKVRRYCRDVIGSESLNRVWVHPMHVATAVKEVKDSQLQVCSVIDFPLGCCTVDMKVAQATSLKGLGAHELGLMVFQAYLVQGNLDQLEDEVKQVQAAIGATPLHLVVDPTALSQEQVAALEKFGKKNKLSVIKLADGFLLDRYTVKI